MSFFESLIVLLAVAVVLLQVARRLSIPYPTMLAGAGVAIALIPGAPQIGLEPQTALALFIAPVLIDAAFDFPVGAALRLWRPLFALAVVAVALSAGAVAWLGVHLAGLPLYAAVALGAIVAPPDAAAATAVLTTVAMPRRSMALLKGESLLNDAAALLLFTAATQVQSHGGLDGKLILQLGIAAPGGLLLGFVLARLTRYAMPFVSGTLGGTLFEFIACFGVWLIAERLHLSAVLCLVAFAMTIARSANLTTLPRVRIHSFAVWGTAVFLLNVVAFLLMGLQVRLIVGGMTPDRFKEVGLFALVVIACLIAIRLGWVVLYNRLAHRFVVLRGDYEPASLRHGILVGWCGMRGLVTMATAFALPIHFPQRDLIVFTGFAVVLATLVVQGLTLAPLVRLLGLEGDDGLDRELAEARRELALAALSALDKETGPTVEHWRFAFRTAADAGTDKAALEDKHRLGLKARQGQRDRLQQLHKDQRIGADSFLVLQEELDFAEVAVSSEDDRQIEEG